LRREVSSGIAIIFWAHTIGVGHGRTFSYAEPPIGGRSVGAWERQCAIRARRACKGKLIRCGRFGRRHRLAAPCRLASKQDDSDVADDLAAGTPTFEASKGDAWMEKDRTNQSPPSKRNWPWRQKVYL